MSTDQEQPIDLPKLAAGRVWQVAERAPSSIVVHPDVLDVASIVIRSLTDADRMIHARGYHLEADAIHLCIDRMPVASIIWHEDSESWCLTQPPVSGGRT